MAIRKPLFKKNAFEVEAWAQNRLICGIDEVGRGCLAGPVVTAAAILHPGKNSRLIKDSKVLTPQERLKAYTWLIKNSWYGIGIVHHRLIDQHNIWHATLIAMKKALLHVMITAPEHPEFILVDAMPLELSDTSYHGIPVQHFIKGESKSSSIAAASIIAKVTRDAMMTRFESVFPGYHLAQHKGYSTALHKTSLQKHHPSVIHRQSFLKNLFPAQEHDEHQQTLC